MEARRAVVLLRPLHPAGPIMPPIRLLPIGVVTLAFAIALPLELPAGSGSPSPDRPASQAAGESAQKPPPTADILALIDNLTEAAGGDIGYIASLSEQTSLP